MMFRRTDQAPAASEPTPLPPGEIIRTGHEDWNARINRAIASETSWKYTAWALLALAAGSGAGNVWQALQSKAVQTVHIVHESIGPIIAAQVEGAGQSKPTTLQLAAELRQWITNVRTVGVDIKSMKRNIISAFDRVDPSSQAFVTLSAFYNGSDPFKRAALETVDVSDAVAIPPPPLTVGKDDLQTWRVQWRETVTGRDGLVHSVTNQVVTLSMTVTTPNSVEEAVKNPDGIHIASFSWTKE